MKYLRIVLFLALAVPAFVVGLVWSLLARAFRHIEYILAVLIAVLLTVYLTRLL